MKNLVKKHFHYEIVLFCLLFSLFVSVNSLGQELQTPQYGSNYEVLNVIKLDVMNYNGLPKGIKEKLRIDNKNLEKVILLTLLLDSNTECEIKQSDFVLKYSFENKEYTEKCAGFLEGDDSWIIPRYEQVTIIFLENAFVIKGWATFETNTNEESEIRDAIMSLKSSIHPFFLLPLRAREVSFIHKTQSSIQKEFSLSPSNFGEILGQLESDKQEKETVRIEGEIMPPKLLKHVYPEYPREAIEARTQGIVILEATTDIDGTVKDLKVIKTVSPLLDQAAIDAVRQWVYEPLIINGKAKRAILKVQIKFELRRQH